MFSWENHRTKWWNLPASHGADDWMEDIAGHISRAYIRYIENYHGELAGVIFGFVGILNQLGDLT